MKAIALAFGLLVTSAALSQTPSATVRSFVDAINRKDMDAAARYVKGGKVSAELRRMMSLERSWPKLTLTSIREQVSGNRGAVSYQISMAGIQSAPPPHRESLTTGRIGAAWLILDAPFPRVGGQTVLPDIVHLLANPNSLTGPLNQGKSVTCLSNAKQLAISCLMYSSDYDDKLPISLQSTTPYHKNSRLLTCPLDPPGRTSYSINPSIVGLAGTKVRRPSDTVLLYEGAGGKLNFRHEGRAAVAFCDGHAKLVAKAEASKLIWKP